MLRTFAAAVVALLAAGCTGGYEPGGATSTTTAATTPATTTGATTPPTTPPATPNSGSTTSATSPTTSPHPGVDLQDGHAEDTATDGTFPGLIVAGQVDVSGDVARLEASASNIGERTYRVSSICVPPWTDGMQGPEGESVPHREPVAYCLAFGLREFPPGESIPFSAAWNGTLWDGDGYTPAPDGAYTWMAHFEVYSGGEGADFDQNATLTLEFQVTVA